LQPLHTEVTANGKQAIFVSCFYRREIDQGIDLGH
jgi:hypothetical protein